MADLDRAELERLRAERDTFMRAYQDSCSQLSRAWEKAERLERQRDHARAWATHWRSCYDAALADSHGRTSVYMPPPDLAGDDDDGWTA